MQRRSVKSVAILAGGCSLWPSPPWWLLRCSQETQTRAVYDAVNAIGPKHHRPYLVQAKLLGRRVARYMAKNYFEPVGHG
jgi:hypothetical protein